MSSFKIDFLDHVAIRVKKMEVSAAWYERVLGLKRWQPEEWKPFPIMMLAGNAGVAIFPLRENDPPRRENPDAARIDHFAFRVDRENFELAHARYDELGLEYRIANHHWFLSIYTFDPDGHEVELTTPLVNRDKNDQSNQPVTVLQP